MTNKYNAAGFESMQFGGRGTGCITGAANLQTTDTGESSDMGRYRGANSAPFELPAPTVLNIPGDDGVRSIFMFDSDARPQFVLEMSDMDDDFKALAENIANVADGDWDTTPLAYDGLNPNQLMLMLSRQSKSQKAGEVGAKGYEHLLLLNCEAKFLGSGLSSKGAAVYRWNVICNSSSFLPDGREVADVYTDAPNGELGALLIKTPARFTYSTFVGDGTEVSPVLAYKPITTARTKATVETTGFAAGTVSSIDDTTPYGYTLSAAPGASKYAVCRYEFVNW